MRVNKEPNIFWIILLDICEGWAVLRGEAPSKGGLAGRAMGALTLSTWCNGAHSHNPACQAKSVRTIIPELSMDSICCSENGPVC